MRLFLHVHTRDRNYKPVMLRVNDAYDPNEKRDPDSGKWSKSGGSTEEWKPPQNNTCGLCVISHVTGKSERELWDTHGKRFSKGGINRNDLWQALGEHGLTFGNIDFGLTFSNFREAKARKLKELPNVAPQEGTYIVGTKNHWLVLKDGKLLDPDIKDNSFRLGASIGPNTQVKEIYKIIKKDDQAVHDAWKEIEHPRGQPDNPGQFTSGGGSSAKSESQPVFRRMTPREEETTTKEEPEQTQTHPEFHGLKAPKSFYLDFESSRTKYYKDWFGNKLELTFVGGTGFWDITNTEGKRLASGEDQEGLDKAIEKHSKPPADKNTAPYPEQGGLIPPHDFEPLEDTKEYKTYKAPNGNILKLTELGDWRLYMSDGRRLIGVGDTQEEMDKAIEEDHQITKPQAKNGISYGRAAFPGSNDLKPQLDFQLKATYPKTKIYTNKYDHILVISSDNYWTLSTDGGETKQKGETQEEMDEAIGKAKQDTEEKEKAVRSAKPKQTSRRQWSGITVNTTVGLDEEFVSNIKQSFDKLPKRMHDSMKKAGITLSIAHAVTDIIPELHGVQPRGWAQGSTWDQAEGLYNPSGKRAIISQFLKRDYNREVKTDRGPGVLRHECGHAYDHALGQYSTGDTFRQAYQSDVREHNLSISKNPEYAYYLQSGDAGPSEAFAEITGQINGGGCDPTNLLEAFPKTTKLLRGLLT